MPGISFQEFASAVSRGSGKPAAFIGCVLLVAGWAVAGPFSGYSNAWLLSINTISSIVTLLMVFLIQNGQIREGIAAQAKLNALILALEEAENRFIGIERLTQRELGAIEKEFSEVADEVAEAASDSVD